MRTPGILCLILFFIIITCPAQAGESDIVLTTPGETFAFPLGEEANIPVTIKNGLGEDVRGTLTVKVYESPATGTASSYQRKTMTAFSGQNTIQVSAGRSDETKTILIDIAFEYGNNPGYSSVIKGIQVNFGGSLESLTSGSSIPEVISNTEIQASSTPANTYQYTGNDLNTLTEDYPDSAALQSTLLAEQIEDEFIRQELLSTITGDPLFISENETFSGLNYSLSKIHTEGTDYGRGSFACNYHKADRESEVLVTGIIENGEIVNIVEKINNSILLTPEFNGNITLEEMLTTLDSDGFLPVETAIIITSDGGRHLEVSLKKGIYSASVFAEYKNDTITSIRMEKDNFLPFYVIPLIVVLLAIINAFAIYLYISIKAEKERPVCAAEPPIQNQNPKEPALRSLDEAEVLFREGYRKEATCLAARTLREWIASEFFSDDEITDGRCIEFLAKYGDEGVEAIKILSSTENTRYSQGSTSEEEFNRMVATIREIILSRSENRH